ncbi:Y-family DNA polymerase [Weissella soli]|uniref:Y-family DNA polymerase n=2 Tax=Weissella soli TaxID=155866 RepID=UPI0035A06E8A
MYDYRNERYGVVFMIDAKSFYASVEAVDHGYDPLQVPLVVLSQGPNVGGGGLVLATSPMAKKMFGLKTNVSRRYDLPEDQRLKIYPPRMNLYIKKNLEINRLFQEFAAPEDIQPYSIDESIVDVTHSWHLFGQSPVEVAQRMQRRVYEATGLYLTIGIGNNPMQAKLALDNYAKRAANMIGIISYETVPNMIWPLNDLEQVWSIGHRTARKLQRLGIRTLYDLAHYNPNRLKELFGVIGEQLYALSWGVDRAIVSQKTAVKEQSIGNSQVLPRDYDNLTDLRIVVREITEQVATRLRFQHKQAQVLSLTISYGYGEGFSKQATFVPTNLSTNLVQAALFLLVDNYQGTVVRNVAVYTSKLIPDKFEQLDIFVAPETQVLAHKLDHTISAIQRQFGFTKLVKASSLLDGGTAIERASLVGGHNGGNAYE